MGKRDTLNGQWRRYSQLLGHRGERVPSFTSFRKKHGVNPLPNAFLDEESGKVVYGGITDEEMLGWHNKFGKLSRKPFLRYLYRNPIKRFANFKRLLEKISAEIGELRQNNKKRKRKELNPLENAMIRLYPQAIMSGDAESKHHISHPLFINLLAKEGHKISKNSLQSRINKLRNLHLLPRAIPGRGEIDRRSALEAAKLFPKYKSVLDIMLRGRRCYYKGTKYFTLPKPGVFGGKEEELNLAESFLLEALMKVKFDDYFESSLNQYVGQKLLNEAKKYRRTISGEERHYVSLQAGDVDQDRYKNDPMLRVLHSIHTNGRLNSVPKTIIYGLHKFYGNRMFEIARHFGRDRRHIFEIIKRTDPVFKRYLARFEKNK